MAKKVAVMDEWERGRKVDLRVFTPSVYRVTAHLWDARDRIETPAGCTYEGFAVDNGTICILWRVG